MKQTTMRNALGFRKSFAVRRLERGSVRGCIIIFLILLAAVLVPISIWFYRVLEKDLTLSGPYTGNEQPSDLEIAQGRVDGIEDKADFSGAEELKPESENEAPEQTSVQP